MSYFQCSQIIALLIFNISINCSADNNLKLIDGSNKVLNYCDEKKSEDEFNFMTYQSQWVALQKKGNLSFSFSIKFVLQIDTCGIQKTSLSSRIQSRIVGGKESIKNIYPWQVLLTDG